jgi:putative ATP-dependent endonuclease of OLD family
MYISRINIKNYRCFRDTTLEFNQGLNLIIGENNSGKTTVLRALELIFDRSSFLKPSIDDFYRKDSFEKPPQITVTITLEETENESHSDKAIVATWLTKLASPWEASLTYVYFLPESNLEDYQNEVEKAKNKGTTDFYKIFQQYLPKYVSKIYGGKLESRNRAEYELLEKFECQIFDALRDVEREMLTGRNPLLKQVLNHFLDYGLRSQPQQRQEKKEEFKNDSNELIRKLQQRLNIDHILELAKNTGASVGGTPFVGGDLDESDIITALKLMIRKSGIEIPISHNGLGYNNLIFISLILSNLERITSTELGENAIIFPMLLIEEPEAHLHPALQYNFLKFILKEIENKQLSRQIFLTTHSTHITAAVSLDSVICLSMNESEESNVAYPGRVFSDSTEDKKSKRYIETYLDSTKSNILFSKGSILVEGITEQLILPRFAEILRLSLEEKHIATVRVDGSTFKHFIKLFGGGINDDKKKYALTQKISCLMDTDPQKKEKKDNSRWRSCWPFEIEPASDEYDYKTKSGVIENLERQPLTANIKICYNKTKKGKTFEYDLMLSNINNAIFSENLEVIEDNETMNEFKENRNLNEAIKRSKWQRDELEIARIAASYLVGIDKGENAFELERKLRDNLTKIESGQININIPDHIIEAIQWVCS